MSCRGMTTSRKGYRDIRRYVSGSTETEKTFWQTISNRKEKTQILPHCVCVNKLTFITRPICTFFVTQICRSLNLTIGEVLSYSVVFYHLMALNYNKPNADIKWISAYSLHDAIEESSSLRTRLRLILWWILSCSVECTFSFKDLPSSWRL